MNFERQKHLTKINVLILVNYKWVPDVCAGLFQVLLIAQKVFFLSTYISGSEALLQVGNIWLCLCRDKHLYTTGGFASTPVNLATFQILIPQLPVLFRSGW